MDVLLKPRVEVGATEQMAHCRSARDISQFKNQRERKSRLSDMHEMVISCFHSNLRLQT